MALWGKTDELASQPKWLSKMYIPDGFEVIFVDSNEAVVEENRARGLKTPGWYLYKSWENEDGSVQHSAELLVAMSGADLDITALEAGDADDDTIAADLEITIVTQPDDGGPIYIVSPDSVTLSVEATINGDAPLSYQWYDASDDTAIEGATSATVTLEDITAPQSYYVVVSSANGDLTVQSNTASVEED